MPWQTYPSRGFTLVGSDFILVGVIVLLAVLAAVFGAVVVLLRWNNDRVAAQWSACEAVWGPAILGHLAGKPAESVHALVPSSRGGHFVDFLVRYARKIKGADLAGLRALGSPYLASIARRARRGNSEHRARMIQMLGVLGLPRYNGEVVAALDDPSPLVSMTAARLLSRKEYVCFAAEVARRIDRYESWSDEYLASMFAAAGLEAAPSLRDVLSDRGRSARARAVVALALAMLRDPHAAAPANEVLPETTNSDLLSACLDLIAEVGSLQHLDMVRQLARSEDEVVRGHAISTLGRIGTAVDSSVVRDAIGDSSAWVALRAARALMDIGGEADLRSLAASSNPLAGLARQVLSERVFSDGSGDKPTS